MIPILVLATCAYIRIVCSKETADYPDIPSHCIKNFPRAVLFLRGLWQGYHTLRCVGRWICLHDRKAHSDGLCTSKDVLQPVI